MNWQQVFDKVTDLAATPAYGRIGGLRRFNGEEWTRLQLTKWNCPDWEEKVDRVNQFFKGLDWEIGDVKVAHKVEKDGEIYARWYFFK